MIYRNGLLERRFEKSFNIQVHDKLSFAWERKKEAIERSDVVQGDMKMEFMDDCANQKTKKNQ